MDGLFEFVFEVIGEFFLSKKSGKHRVLKKCIVGTLIFIAVVLLIMWIYADIVSA